MTIQGFVPEFRSREFTSPVMPDLTMKCRKYVQLRWPLGTSVQILLACDFAGESDGNGVGRVPTACTKV